jgi:hypothetical protein
MNHAYNDKIIMTEDAGVVHRGILDADSLGILADKHG